MKFSRQVNFAILRNSFTMNHFNFAILSKTLLKVLNLSLKQIELHLQYGQNLPHEMQQRVYMRTVTSSYNFHKNFTLVR